MKRVAITGMVCESEGSLPHSLLTQHRTMTNNDFLYQELTLDELKTINGSGVSGWVFRVWKRWITDEADDVVNSLGDLNDYAKKNTSDSMEEN